MSRPTKLLVVQFPYDSTRTPQDNLSFRHDLEDVLGAALRRNHSGEVDGGEIEPDGINIWAYLSSWKHGIPVIQAYLKHRRLLSRVVIAKKINEDKWEVVWPRDYENSFSVLGSEAS